MDRGRWMESHASPSTAQNPDARAAGISQGEEPYELLPFLSEGCNATK